MQNTTPNNGTLPRSITSPPTNMPIDRGTPPNMGTPINRGAAPRTSMPMNGTTPPATGTPMRGTTPPTTGTPMRGTTPPTTGMPMRDTTPPTTGMPMRGITPPTTGMPMRGTTPPTTGMPMRGTTPPATGMPMRGITPPTTGMPMRDTTPPTTGMPMNRMPMNGMVPGVPMNNISMPNNTPYNTPMGIPLYPLYGYDNCEDLDRDMDYIKQLYPDSARRILGEVNNECDKLEYDGSVMFDEYPDKVSLDRIIDRIYERIGDIEEFPQVQAKGLYNTPRRRQNIFRDFISIILLNEILNRRRRYRSRRRWF